VYFPMAVIFKDVLLNMILLLPEATGWKLLMMLGLLMAYLKAVIQELPFKGCDHGYKNFQPDSELFFAEKGAQVPKKIEQKQLTKPFPHEQPFKPANPPKRGCPSKPIRDNEPRDYLGGIYEYVGDPEKKTERKPKPEGEDKGNHRLVLVLGLRPRRALLRDGGQLAGLLGRRHPIQCSISTVGGLVGILRQLPQGQEKSKNQGYQPPSDGYRRVCDWPSCPCVFSRTYRYKLFAPSVDLQAIRSLAEIYQRTTAATRTNWMPVHSCIEIESPRLPTR